jgi:hypothetical protein
MTDEKKAQLGQAGRKKCLLRMEKQDLINLILQYEKRVKRPEQISSFIEDFIFNAQAQVGERFR